MHFQRYNSDIRMIGKHFKLRSHANLDITRHYTICNVMEPGFYAAINKALKEDNYELVVKHLDEGVKKTDTAMFTIKNYDKPKGLSFRFFTDQEHDFEVSGPFGKGLIEEQAGTHIAFAAGTGVLCFVDLVAHFALKNLRGNDRAGGDGSLNSKRGSKARKATESEFKLILYVSFPNRAGSIALDFFENMQAHAI